MKVGVSGGGGGWCLRVLLWRVSKLSSVRNCFVLGGWEDKTERAADRESGCKVRTVFVGSSSDRVGAGPVPDGRSGQHPDLVLGPALQLVQRQAGGVEGGHRGLGVGAAVLDEEYLIVHYGPVGPLDRRRQPGHVDRRGAGRLDGYITGRCTGDYMNSAREHAVWVVVRIWVTNYFSVGFFFYCCFGDSFTFCFFSNFQFEAENHTRNK